MALNSDEVCEHVYKGQGGTKNIKKFNKVIVDGIAICPRCFTEKETARLKEQVEKEVEDQEKNSKKNMLYKHSQLDDVTILDATIENYITSCVETTENKQKALEVIKKFIKGEVFSLFIQGKQGTGKSHLGYSILRAINESGLMVSNIRELREKEKDMPICCLFISIEKMLRLIKDSFGNKESKYTEQYFIDLLSNVDFLVLDDLGAETGAIDSNKNASDFVQRVLYAVMNARQGKVTIITSNLSGETLFNMYDKKLVSRMLRKPYYIIFKTAKDKRQEQIPF
jgi:DNA replication protein DnaC